MEILPAGKRFVDLFSGGGAMSHAAMLSGKYKATHAKDNFSNTPLKYHPILVFMSLRDDVDGVVVLIDAKDNDGNNVTVAIDLNGEFKEIEVNEITSMYGKDSYAGFSAWSENILLGNELELKAWIASLPVNDKRGVSKSTLSKLQERLQEVLISGANITNNSESPSVFCENLKKKAICQTLELASELTRRSQSLSTSHKPTNHSSRAA